MSAEDQEMMARISQLAGQINRHKNRQAGIAAAPGDGARYAPYYLDDFRYAGPSHPHPRGGYPSRGGHRAVPRPVHRHRTLILNGTSQSNSDPGTPSGTPTTPSSWVTKNDRHLQLINSSVYEKEAQARTRAIEQTRRQKQTIRDERERAKLLNHLNHTGYTGAASANFQISPGKYEITVQSIRFIVAKNGSKLVKVSDDTNSATATPKMAMVGGVKFYRSKNGNLYRHGIVKAQRQSGTVKKVNVPCKMFSMTGSCTQGPRCRYIHDPEKVAACKDMLQQGDCPSGDACDLSHDLSPHRTPTCLHFARDSCTKPNCRYAHVKVTPAAPVCRAFGIYGYCEKGADCTDRHAFECPDFSNTGICKSKGCKLPHRERASVLRKANARDTNSGGDAEMEDISSDDESIDGDDVDSDEVDEFIGQDETENIEFKQQRDFIEL
ncbi:zinc finger domain-containing protein [Bombardia bombarda]|uniref:Zinc finger domain-containing protein n=1 Tax=Bombardia bombarda TaxID=252184 RepID=A0AA39TUP8_9PEZI|nr:zinc finger domain-containing protein [Bombardia bombarda]